MSPDEGLVCCTAGDRDFALRGADVRQIVPVEKMRAVGGAAVRMLVTMVQDEDDCCHYEDSPVERDAYLRASCWGGRAYCS